MNSSYISSLSQNASSALGQSKIETLLTSIKGASANADESSEAEIKEAFKQFEGLFLSQLLKTMFKTVPVNELFGGGFAEETFQEMLVDEYGTIIAKQGGIGIAENMQRTLLNLQLSGNEDDTSTITAEQTGSS